MRNSNSLDIEQIKMNLIDKENKISWGSYLLDRDFKLNKNDVINIMFKRDEVIIPTIISKNLIQNNKTLIIDIPNRFKNETFIKENNRIINLSNNEDFLNTIQKESFKYDCVLVNGFNLLSNEKDLLNQRKMSTNFFKETLVRMNFLRNEKSPSFIFLNSCEFRETYSVHPTKIELPTEINYFYDLASESYSIKSGKIYDGSPSLKIKKISSLENNLVEVSASSNGIFLLENELFLFLINANLINIRLGKTIHYNCPIKLIKKDRSFLSFGDKVEKFEFLDMLKNCTNRVKIIEFLEMGTIGINF